MRIANVKIKNFRGYGEADTEDGMYCFTHLDDTDIVIFTGYNGFGKTGFFEAIEWCITGKIKGLQEDNTERYDKPTMKNSSYLKFQCEVEGKEREVVVSVIFDNKWGITRRTKCNSLEEQNYSDFILDLKDNKIKQDDIDKIIKQYTGQKPEQLLKLSFNGQNRNTDFVKSVKAKDRTGTLLEFMGLETISEIVEQSDRNKNRKLKKTYDEVESQYNITHLSILKIQQIFKSNNWGKIEDYKSIVKAALEMLNSVQEKLVNEGLMTETMSLPSEQLKDLLESLIKVKILKENLEKKNIINKKKILKLTEKRLIYKWNQINYKLKQADLVKKVDIKSLEAEKIRLNELVEIYQNSINQLEAIIQAVDLETVIVEPLTSAETIGIAKEEKIQYERYLTSYIKLQDIGKGFSILGDYQYYAYDIEKEYRRSQKYDNFIKSYEYKIKLETQKIKELEGVYTEQAELLMQVQNYVNKQENIDSCPVCGGLDFIKEEQHGKEQLLNIISIKMSDGNEQLKSINDNIVRQEKRLSVFRQKIRELIRDRYRTNLKKLINEIHHLENEVKEICRRQMNCNQIAGKKCRTRLSGVSSQISQFQEFIKDYKEDDIGSVIEKNEQLKLKIETVLNTKFLLNNNEILGQEVGKEKTKIIPLFSIKKLLEKAIEYIDGIVKYDVGVENVAILKEYETKCEELERLKKRKDLIQKAYTFRDLIYSNSKKLQNEFLSTMIEDNEMINWIYGRINPHPFFREIKLMIRSSKNQTDIISAERQTVYLDHIFSEAQMNVLSLSIFLGLVFSVRNYGFKQIFLDDPVQSLDDINEVSFIDLLRALIQSKEVDKNCIISTHDHNFSQLMKIKLRNYNFVEYRFESYGLEGPRIKTIVNRP